MDWAKSHDFGRFLYQSYNETDFDAANVLYRYKWGTFWTKPNLTKNMEAVSRIWDTKLEALYLCASSKYILVEETVT